MIPEHPAYRPLKSMDRKTWLADDHILKITNGLLREDYTRLYWVDIRAALLYSLDRPDTLLVVAEVSGVALAVSGATLISPPWGVLAALVFVAIYAAWRFIQPGWAAQIYTKVTSVKLPLASSLASSRRLLSELTLRVSRAQERVLSNDALALSPGPLVISTVSGSKKDPAQSKRVPVIFYGCLFAFGAVSGFNAFTVFLYCLLFVVTFFIRRDFEFPFSIRSATVLNQMLAVSRIVIWLASWRRPFLLLVGSRLTIRTEFVVASMILSLYGLLSVVVAVRRSGQYDLRSSTILGLDTPSA